MISKFLSSSRREFLFLVVAPFLLWMVSFWDFISGKARIMADSWTYYNHIDRFTSNIISGVYPLWDPNWFNGAPNNFFLRRIGEFNPFYWIVAILKMLGVPSYPSYLVFLVFYYFLAVFAFWAIAKLFLRDRLACSGAFLLLLFSSWGGQLFHNYIILVLVPLLWFTYFLIAFFKEQKKHQFLGIFFSASLAMNTYIPFFFVTVVLVYIIFFIPFFWKDLGAFLGRTISFVAGNKIFVAGCVGLFLLACVPAVDFYNESKRGEFSMPGRHSGAAEASAVAVSADGIRSGDMLTLGFFDKVFSDHGSLVMADSYFPYIIFLIILITAINPVSRATLFLLANIFFLTMITISEASPVYQFLFDNVFFFRFMRMTATFYWIAILPLLIFFGMEQLRVFCREHRGKGDKRVLFFVVLVHFVFGYWALTREGVGWSSWLSIGFSLAFFLGLLFKRWDSWVLFGLLLLAVVVQPLHMARTILRNSSDSYKAPVLAQGPSVRTFHYLQPQVLVSKDKESGDEFLQGLQKGLYYSARWYADVHTFVPANDREKFIAKKLYLIDNTRPFNQLSREFFTSLGAKWSAHENVALLFAPETRPEDFRSFRGASSTAQVITEAGPQVEVLSYDANTLRLKVNIDRSKFLLWTDNYHSGWHVFINGKEGKVLRADFAFKGVWLPEGESTVLFRFATPLRYAGAFVMMIIFAGALGVMVYWGRKEKFCLGGSAADEH